MPTLPLAIVTILLPFAPLLTTPTWVNAQVLLIGTLLTQGPRTVTAALRTMGLGQARCFGLYHRVLNRARWSGRRGAQILLGLLIVLIPPACPLVIAVDETLERRQGARIAAKGMYRDAVRSSRRQVVTCLGVWRPPFNGIAASTRRDACSAGSVSGTPRGGRPWQSAGCWSSIPPARSIPRRFSPPT